MDDWLVDSLGMKRAMKKVVDVVYGKKTNVLCGKSIGGGILGIS